ncbi:uncharacterized protein LOC131155296 [Malania oleifera]|uniref:uncharacterized protein LOC131155296 n=1 Tax=Malania oleifera TaxID=397392 RepID=UPI0025ADE696|nr:uncharacterized protein LOC131155296 [Malania oleifera]
MRSSLGITSRRSYRAFFQSNNAHRPRNHDIAAIAAVERKTEHKPITGSHQEPPLSPPNLPYPSSPRLQIFGVKRRLDPTALQKRSSSSIEEVNCVGLDGTPVGGERREVEDGRADEEQMVEYYRQHKASPLSEIEVVDTRKPITQATDGTAGDYEGRGEERVVGWRPEQLDTAEEALRRAMEIWRENAMRGDPDSPHGRVLRGLHGEV